jgi:hypothetical protein
MPALGLVTRKQLWLPTVRGWAVIFGAAALLTLVTIKWTVPFLAPVDPLSHGILVVEGWLPDYALAEAKRTFETHPYRLLLVTGVPIDQGFYLTQETNYAHFASATLRHLGAKEEAIVPIVCPTVPRDRTYATACRVRAWLDEKSVTDPVDVFTLGVHARRTWLLYRMALGAHHPTGVIAGEDQRYDRKAWWKTSSGFRTVTSEVIAYVYARLVFRPHTEAAPIE